MARGTGARGLSRFARAGWASIGGLWIGGAVALVLDLGAAAHLVTCVCIAVGLWFALPGGSRAAGRLSERVAALGAQGAEFRRLQRAGVDRDAAALIATGRVPGADTDDTAADDDADHDRGAAVGRRPATHRWGYRGGPAAADGADDAGADAPVTS